MDQRQQTEQCGNCRKKIATNKMASHVGYCRRNVIRCPTCSQMYDKNALEQHEEEFHYNTKCKHCEKMFRKKQIAAHAPKCPMKPKICEYCELQVTVKQLAFHIKQCESRTSVCEKCHKSIINKEMQIHVLSCRGLKPTTIKQPLSRMSRLLQQEDILSSMISSKADKKIDVEGRKQNAQKKEQPSNANPVKERFPRLGIQKQPIPPSRFKKKQQSSSILDNSINFSQFDYSIWQEMSNASFDTFPQTILNQSNDQFVYEPSLISCDEEERHIQDILLQSSKKSKQKKLDNSISATLPSDFHSEDIMNCSFYGQILDIEKQKAIMEDLKRSQRKRW